MIYVDLDFETQSLANLKVVGADRYAQDPSTQILCLCYGAKAVWCPSYDDPKTCQLIDLVANPEAIFVAHNAGFEQAIWRHIMVARYGFPEIPIERWEDTMASAAWKSLPLALDTGSRSLRLAAEKDKDGNRLTLSMSKPGKDGRLPEPTLEQLDRIVSYCRQDVVVESAMRRRIGLLSDQSRHERAIWCLDQRINQRGVRIDIPFVRAALQVVERATGPLQHEFAALTGGLGTGQVAEIMKWCAKQGTVLPDMRKETIDKLFAEEDATDDAGYDSFAAPDDLAIDVVPGERMVPSVRRVLAIRRMLGSASIKKLNRMLACVGSDGRARGLLQYHAAHPGRWGGRLLQPQNFPRGSLKANPDAVVEAIMSGDPEFVEIMLARPAIECVSSALRHALIPDPGKTFLVGDFAGIEAAIVLALAGQHDKTALMAQGYSIYFDMAEDLYNKPKGTWSKLLGDAKEAAKKAFPKEYQNGKGGILGCGFQCGVKNYNAKFLSGENLELADKIVSTYRTTTAPKVPKVWYALEAAALRAFARPTEAYGVTWRRQDEWMTARLPSGWQVIWYHHPRQCEGRFGNPAWSYIAHKGGKVVNTQAYGGLLTENVVQGLARGLLVASMMRLEKAGYPLVLTVHDEAVAEVDEAKADLQEFESLMSEPTGWASDMKVPVAVEAWQGSRYRK